MRIVKERHASRRVLRRRTSEGINDDRRPLALKPVHRTNARHVAQLKKIRETLKQKYYAKYTDEEFLKAVGELKRVSRVGGRLAASPSWEGGVLMAKRSDLPTCLSFTASYRNSDLTSCRSEHRATSTSI
jgi:hypothetical protein